MSLAVVPAGQAFVKAPEPCSLFLCNRSIQWQVRSTAASEADLKHPWYESGCGEREFVVVPFLGLWFGLVHCLACQPDVPHSSARAPDPDELRLSFCRHTTNVHVARVSPSYWVGSYS